MALLRCQGLIISLGLCEKDYQVSDQSTGSPLPGIGVIGFRESGSPLEIQDAEKWCSMWLFFVQSVAN